MSHDTNYQSELRRAGFEAHDNQWSIKVAELANIAEDTVGRHARSTRGDHPALIYEAPDGSVQALSFTELNDKANRLASNLRKHGVDRGQPVGVHLDQRPETAIAHLALYKLGAIVCTMSGLYGQDTLTHILRDTGLRMVFTRAPRGPLADACAAPG